MVIFHSYVNVYQRVIQRYSLKIFTVAGLLPFRGRALGLFAAFREAKRQQHSEACHVKSHVKSCPL
jgi:hypothetical protein